VGEHAARSNRFARFATAPAVGHGARNEQVIDPIQLRQIWSTHGDRLTLIARSIVDSQDAEDAVQEAFVSLAVQTMLPDDPLAWLVRVVRNQLLQWRRSQGRRRRREQQRLQRDPGASAWFVQPQLAIDQTLDAVEVANALRDLPEDQREVIVMHLWGEMTFERIAAVLGGSRSTVHRLYARGLIRLKQRFEPDEPLSSNPTQSRARNEPGIVSPQR
jgi:RNA polymerase sigma factor (sigma-70 family)